MVNCSVEIPGLRLVNPLNGSHRSWLIGWRRAKGQKKTVWNYLGTISARNQMELLACRRWTITIIRRGPGTMDKDNLAASAKHVRDTIARFFLVDDGSSRFTWKYAQEATKRGKIDSYSVRLELVGR